MSAGVYHHEKGEHSNHWQGGKPLCCDCQKQLTSYQAKRCRQCHSKYKSGTNHPFYGKHHSVGTREKISRSKLANPSFFSEEVRKKMGEASLRRWKEGISARICVKCNISYTPTGFSQRFCKNCGILNDKKMDYLYSRSAKGIASRGRYDRSEKGRIKYQRYRAKPEYRIYTAKRMKPGSDRYKAQYYLTNAVRDKRLVRANACSECGRKDWGIKRSMIEGHHYKGYAPENWLEIKWLCTDCHKLAHGFIKGGDALHADLC